MNEIPHITERVDDIPLLIEQMQRMGLPTLLDTHFPTHGNWTGLSLGWVSTIWLSSMLSRGDHRMVHVEPWVAKRLWTLGFTTGQAVMRVDFTDDRLEIVLRRLSEDTRWAAFESALNQHTVRVYDLSTARVHVDSPSASVYATISEGGLFRSEEHTSELQSRLHLVCRLLLEKKKSHPNNARGAYRADRAARGPERKPDSDAAPP